MEGGATDNPHNHGVSESRPSRAEVPPLVFGIIAKKVDGGQGDAVVGLAQASDGGAGESPHIPWVTTTLATLPCSNSALEFIKYPGVDGELLIHTPS